MRVRVWPADNSGCGSYRLIFPGTALAQAGADVVVETTGPTVTWDRRWTGAAPPLDAEVLDVARPDADVVVIQRPARRIWCEVIDRLQAHGVRVVVDVDDAFDAIPRDNTAYRAYAPGRSPHHNHQWVARACEVADMVTVTTPALAARYARHGRVRVLPNLVPAWYLDVAGDRDPAAPMVAWSGSVDTHPHDLEVTGGAVATAVAAVPGARLGVVGTGAGVAVRLRCDVGQVTGWLPFAEYPLALAKVDVGVVPLHDSPFNTAKSALKGSEFAALGAVPVMSPTPDNRRLHALGVGVLAGSTGQWRRQLTRLLRDRAYREYLAAAARAVMATQTYEGNCGRWWDAWTAATDRQRVAA